MKIPKATKTSVAKAQPTKAKPSVGIGHRILGKTLCLSIGETWAHLLHENATGKAKRTDAQLSAFVHAEYPNRKSAVTDNVSKPRSMYNSGTLTGMEGHKPKVESVEIKEPKSTKTKK